MPEDKGKKSSSKKSSKELAAKAIYVTDKKDPRLRAYNDTLNNSKLLEQFSKEAYATLNSKTAKEYDIKYKNLFKKYHDKGMKVIGYVDANKPKWIKKQYIDGTGTYSEYPIIKPVQPVILQKEKPQPKKTNLINTDPRGKKGVYHPDTNSVFGQLDKNVKYERIGESLYKPITSIKKPVILQKEKPEVKISPVKQEVPARDMTPTGEVKLPTDASIKIERRGGKFAVDYFDVDEKSNLVPKTELFDTADEADSFLKARKEGGKFYGPNITRRGATESEAAKRVASKSSYSQYRKIGTGKEK